MKKIIATCLSFVTVSCFGQLTFQKTYGGTNTELNKALEQTADGGYIMAGYTDSYGAGNWDVYLIKTDSAGNLLWTKTFGGPQDDKGLSMKETSDGGYIISGYSGNLDSADVLLIKTDTNGNLMWSSTYGGANRDIGNSVVQTSDGGYAIAGYTESFATGWDAYLLKTDGTGNLLWTKVIGGANHEEILSLQSTSDGGFILTGYTESYGAGDQDIYLIKTDSTGNFLWTKTFGGTARDRAYFAAQTIDGGYIITGHTRSFTGNYQTYLIKTDTIGGLTWSKTFHRSAYDGGTSVKQTPNGRYIIVATSFDNFTGLHDIYLVRTNSTGDTLWTKAFDGTNSDVCSSIHLTSDSGYVIGAYTQSFGMGDLDFYLIKTDANGNGPCNQESTGLITATPPTQSYSATPTSFSGGSMTSSSIIEGNGGTVTPICLSVGISPVVSEEILFFNISPNPADEYSVISYQFEEEDVLRVTDVIGKTIFTKTFSAPTLNFRLQTLNFNSGIYFVEVISESKKMVRKLVKQ